jgi:formate/nitrite transporter FocA (FNT family)
MFYETDKLCEISGFHHSVVEACAFLGMLHHVTSPKELFDKLFKICFCYNALNVLLGS